MGSIEMSEILYIKIIYIDKKSNCLFNKQSVFSSEPIDLLHTTGTINFHNIQESSKTTRSHEKESTHFYRQSGNSASFYLFLQQARLIC